LVYKLKKVFCWKNTY